MFCNRCKFTSFDQLESCPACGSSWQQLKRELNLDWLVGPYPVQSSDYQTQGLGWEQQIGADTEQAQPGSASGPFEAPQDLELEFTWEEQGASRQEAPSSVDQSAARGPVQDEDIAFPELEGMFDTDQEAAAPGQEEPGSVESDLIQHGHESSRKQEQQAAPSQPQLTETSQNGDPELIADQDGLEFELEPEGEEVDISALFDELEADLDSRRKKK